MPITEEARTLIFTKLKRNFEKFTPPLVIKIDELNRSFELIGNKPVPYGYDKKIVPGMFFASVVQRKESVTFHFFPLYMDPTLNGLALSLYKCLKGKTCFHFKKEEQIDEKELTLLIEKGLLAWEKSGYME